MRALSLRRGALAAFGVFLALPLLGLSYLLYARSSAILRGQMDRLAQISINEMRADIDRSLLKAREVSDIVAANKLIQDFFAETTPLPSTLEQIEAMKLIESLVADLETFDGIRNIRIFVPDRFILAGQKIHFFGMSELEAMPIYSSIEAAGGRLTWTAPVRVRYLDPKEGGIVWSEYSAASAGRIIKKLGTSQVIGAVVVDVEISRFRESLERSLLDEQLNLAVNERGEPIASYSATGAYTEAELSRIARSAGESPAERSSLERDGDFFAITRPLRVSGWTVQSYIPVKEFLSYRDTFQNYVLIFLLIVGLAAFITANFVADRTNARIRRIVASLRRIGAGDLEQRLEVDGRDEIGAVEIHVNRLTDELRGLIEKTYQDGVLIKASELSTLQAQINPHFLYNSLDLVNWMAAEKNAPEISGLVKELSKFYKLSLSGGKSMVSLKEELEHAAIYASIQNRRFGGGLTFRTAVPQRLLEVQIPKITLQPLVENAILHGILERDDQRGTVLVSAEVSGAAGVLRVEDDGVGMDAGTLSVLTEGGGSAAGFGVRNIRTRFALTYGESFGLVFFARPGGGTIAELRFPLAPAP